MFYYHFCDDESLLFLELRNKNCVSLSILFGWALWVPAFFYGVYWPHVITPVLCLRGVGGLFGNVLCGFRFQSHRWLFFSFQGVRRIAKAARKNALERCWGSKINTFTLVASNVKVSSKGIIKTWCLLMRLTFFFHYKVSWNMISNPSAKQYSYL